MTIALFDPSLLDDEGTPSPNTGDQIIALAISRVLDEVFPGRKVVRIPTHQHPSRTAMRNIVGSEAVIIGGSNLLGNRVFLSRRLRHWQQWRINQKEARDINRAILLGVGWRTYEDRVDKYTASMLRAALADQAVHAARDGYTARKLRGLGLAGTVDTSCPTLWRLGSLPVEHISCERSKLVLTTVTDYRPNPEADRKRLDLLSNLYDEVVLWPQSEADLDYLGRLDVKIESLDPGLSAVDQLIRERQFDYVGTRLHGGIYCLEAGRRSLVVAVDNRAQEMLPAVGVPTVGPDRFDEVKQWIEHPRETRITLNETAILTWKAQFTSRS